MKTNHTDLASIAGKKAEEEGNITKLFNTSIIQTKFKLFCFDFSRCSDCYVNEKGVWPHLELNDNFFGFSIVRENNMNRFRKLPKKNKKN